MLFTTSFAVWFFSFLLFACVFLYFAKKLSSCWHSGNWRGNLKAKGARGKRREGEGNERARGDKFNLVFPWESIFCQSKQIKTIENSNVCIWNESNHRDSYWIDNIQFESVWIDVRSRFFLLNLRNLSILLRLIVFHLWRFSRSRCSVSFSFYLPIPLFLIVPFFSGCVLLNS